MPPATHQQLGDQVRDRIDNYTEERIEITEQYTFNTYKTIEKITNYINSRFLTGQKDSQGNDKPFFNIVKGRVNIATRATDIDRKNIRIKATRAQDYFKSFVATRKNQEWMNRARFGEYLNQLGEWLPRYGSAVTKVVRKGNDLYLEIVSLDRLIFDQVSFYAQPIIERLIVTPAEARANKSWDKTQVEYLIQKSQTQRKKTDGTVIQEDPSFIELYEVHGELPVAFLYEYENDPPDKAYETYSQQMHVIALCRTEDDSTEYICLYKGLEEKNPYMKCDYFTQHGRSLGVGVVEDLFEQQKWVNYNKKLQKDQTDISSKSLFQTSDEGIAGKNVISGLQAGQVLLHKPNQPVTSINTPPQAFQALEALNEVWERNADMTTSTPDAIQGNTFPSGTAWRQVELLNQEAHGQFEYVIERKALFIEELYREFIIPYLVSQLDTADEIVATLDAQELEYFDAEVLKAKESEFIKRSLLENGVTPSEEEVQTYIQTIGDGLTSTKNVRFLSPGTKTWKEYFKDFAWDCEVEISGESSNKQALLSTYFTALTTIAQNPGILDNPAAKNLIHKILETAGGTSPIEMTSIAAPKQTQQVPQQSQAQQQLAQVQQMV